MSFEHSRTSRRLRGLMTAVVCLVLGMGAVGCKREATGQMPLEHTLAYIG